MDFTLKWKRPPGPINIWRTKESTKKFKNGKPVKFTIQEIPEDRWEDAVDHMCTYFVEDEPICSSSNIKGDPVALEEFRDVWRIVMKQGCGIGAFIEDPQNEKPILAGMNATHMVTKEDEDKFVAMIGTFKSDLTKKVFSTIMNLTKDCDMKKIYGVDEYLSAFGLSVAPEFRGEKLGLDILLARDDFGKKYSVSATSTFFTAVSSQILAERAGFQLEFERLYEEVLDADGNVAFPKLKGKTVKYMHKKLV